ncbi:uncharacterized protein LOC129765849 [Toxorhynchites rutilus septentrionalis]|uniref:uncharacterized protein LOC129765849 n=1 Tax=Toxorhynchites rutilus septentrionalis TaxID=329112 RepID=UPI00247AB8B3|nr:uncharacterized protein LOC129765849 [Toxorhynchites rutilus septentrionalis]
MLDRVINRKAINERMCVLRIKGQFYNYIIINVPFPHEGRPDDEKEAFYAQLEATYDSCSPRDIKIVIVDMNAQVGREARYRPVIGPSSLHTDTNDNGLWISIRPLGDHLTNIPQTELTTSSSKADFFSNITNIRSLRGADIDTDHYLVGLQVRSKLSRAYNSRQNRHPRFNIRQLKDPQAAENYARLLDEALPSSGELNASNLEDDWSKISSAIEETVTARQQEDRDRDELEQLFQANDTRKFYKKVNQSRKSYTPNPDMCRDEKGNLITSEREVVDKWQQFFDKHLNGEIADGGVMETYLRVPSNDNDVPVPDLQGMQREIGLPKANRAAGKDRLPAELYKHGKNTLATALHWVISRIWEEEKLLEEWMEGIVCPIYKKGDRFECGNYRATITQTNKRIHKIS